MHMGPILIKVIFDYIFLRSNFKLQFPMEHIFYRRSGSLMEQWEINYRFGVDWDCTEFLDCFAFMPDSGHSIVRIYEDGTNEILAFEDKEDGFNQVLDIESPDVFNSIFDMADYLGLTHSPLPNLVRRS